MHQTYAIAFMHVRCTYCMGLCQFLKVKFDAFQLLVSDIELISVKAMMTKQLKAVVIVLLNNKGVSLGTGG
jgi:hypothetical protein